MLNRWTWSEIDPESARRIAAGALFEGDVDAFPALAVRAERAELPFYDSVDLVRLRLGAHAPEGADDAAADAPAVEVHLLRDLANGGLAVLDGTSGPIHWANGRDEVRIDEATVRPYLRLFCFSVRGSEGPFFLYETPVDPAGPAAPADARAAMPDRASRFLSILDDAVGAKIQRTAREIEIVGRDDENRFLLRVPVKFGSDLFVSDFTVDEDGDVEMVRDDHVMGDVPEDLFPTLPVLREPRLVVASLERLALVPPRPHGGAILRLLVELLLEEALVAEQESRLLTHFNAKFVEHAPLDRFARFIVSSAPVVAIESTIPFVEEAVAQLVNEHGDPSVGIVTLHGEPDAGDDTRLHVRVPMTEGLVLISFHAYRGIADSDRVAHELGMREVACLIGCDSVVDLPDNLRQVLDLTLELPRLDASLFERLFQRIVGFDPPGGWQDGADHWVTHVLHTDFQQPLGLRLDPTETLEYVRERARARLRDIEPANDLGLDELHGLGEARSFAEDLIADIHEAVAGRLDWMHVDRGVLLVGPPGTGKTTLARAIARDCGIRFVNASATDWQAAGHLGDHIRAMRSDFSRARRFAPAILFIDEIDSIGNRETFSGQNAQYSTEVVNTLLELVGTFDPEAPVMVMGATNHASRVDPALKRAGRLDRVLEIPRPNAEALGQIYEHYLAEYAADGVDEDVDVRDLGGLSIGATGADVELFVRGAVRRARKADRPVSHVDLVDEITRKPRNPADSLRMSPEEIRRVAVHEAGHALAACLSSSGGRDVAFVTIVPRADGSLGFVARLPSERLMMTRAEYLEQLEIILAGRAAEELVFGADLVTGGAGGSSPTSDLAAGTRWALQMITQYGLGPERNLRWSDEAGDEEWAQAEALLRSCYDNVLGRLRDHEPALRRVAETLIERQELRGDELRAVARLAATDAAS